MAGMVSKGLDSYNSRQERKAAEMAAEREAEQAQRAEERERRRREYEKEQRRYELENIVWGDDFKRKSYLEKIEFLIYQYFYYTHITDSEILGKLRKTSNAKSSDPLYQTWIAKLEENRPSKSASIAEKFNPKPEHNPKLCAREFVALFPDPEPERLAARLERARLRKERQREREEKIKAIVAADEQDKINGTGRWDYSQVRKNKWVALALAISLGLFGAQYFYMGKKFLGWCLCGLVVCSFFSYY